MGENADDEVVGLTFLGGRGTEPKKEIMEGCCFDEADPGSVLLRIFEAEGTLSGVALFELNTFVATVLLYAVVGGGLFILCVEDPNGLDVDIAEDDPNGLEVVALEAPKRFVLVAKGFTTPGRSSAPLAGVWGFLGEKGYNG